MQNQQRSIEADKALMEQWLGQSKSHDFEPRFVPGPGIQKLNLRFDIEALRAALADVIGSLQDQRRWL